MNFAPGSGTFQIRKGLSATGIPGPVRAPWPGLRPSPGDPECVAEARRGGRIVAQARNRTPTGIPAEAFARAIIETVRTPLVLLNPEYEIVAANPAFAEIHDVPDPVTGRDFFEIADGAWDHRELRSELEGVVRGDGELRDLQIQLSTPSAPLIFLVDARHLRLEGDVSPLVVLTLEDVTVQQTYERRLEDYARELERSNRALEGFAHAASHDLHEPLRKIHMYVDRLTDALTGDDLDERTVRYLERLPEAVERMQTRIEDLLQLARIEQATPEPRAVELEPLVEAVLQDLEVLIEESEATVQVGPLPAVRADPAQLRLLFQNLIANGVKFSRAGEPPVIHIRHETGDSEERKSEEDAFFERIVVEDEGIGFEEEYANRIFDPFERLHPRSDYEGSGVGLSICRRVVEANGGRIQARGRPGRGALFTIDLPSVPPADEN